MKKITVAILAIILVAMGAIFVFAQKADGDKPGKRMGKRGHHRGGMMLKGLDLTEEQKAQFKQIRQASKVKTQTLRESLKANRRKMNEATANGAFDEATVTALATEKAGLSVQMTVERARVKSQTFALLTAEQKVKAAEMKTKMKERFKGKMKNRTEAGAAPSGSEL
ncbi:MAG: Spy/CpxP family protein refolding chaperone [Saprospiraceae bacterium]|nr:Spy/CpxP family protein refolding chaperone [Pyrinomonadaceae bacterium]